MNAFEIVYEDDYIIVVNKKSGVLVVPTPKGETNTLTDLLNRYLDKNNIQVNAYPCHRIDRETSGLVIYAKGKYIQNKIMEQFKNKKVKKRYIAFIHGYPKKDFDTLKNSVYNKKKHKQELMIAKYSVLEERRQFSIVEVELITGRTNQIRIQFKLIGCPLVGESVFAFRKDYKLKFKRTALHAERIEFIHPVTLKSIGFEAPLPEDMDAFLRAKE